MKNRLMTLLSATLLLVALQPAEAALTDTDSSFGTSGSVTTDLGPDGGGVLDLFVDGLDRIYVLAYRQRPDLGRDEIVVVRYLASGTLDTSFFDNGIFVPPGQGSESLPDSVGIDSAGRILIGAGSVRVRRYLATGALDTTFGTGEAADFNVGTSYASAGIGEQTDGRLLISGTSYNSPSPSSICQVRLTANGSADTSFGAMTSRPGRRCYSSGQRGDVVRGLRVSSAGALVLGYTDVSTATGFELVPMYLATSPDGEPATLYPQFFDLDVSSINARAAALDGRLGGDLDGVLLYATYDDDHGGTIARLGTARFTLSGGLTVAAANPVTLPSGAVTRHVALQSDGKVILGGYFETAGGAGLQEIALRRLSGDAALAAAPPAGSGSGSGGASGSGSGGSATSDGGSGGGLFPPALALFLLGRRRRACSKV